MISRHNYAEALSDTDPQVFRGQGIRAALCSVVMLCCKRASAEPCGHSCVQDAARRHHAPQAAERLHRQVLAHKERVHGASSVATGTTLNSLGCLLHKRVRCAAPAWGALYGGRLSAGVSAGAGASCARPALHQVSAELQQSISTACRLFAHSTAAAAALCCAGRAGGGGDAAAARAGHPGSTLRRVARRWHHAGWAGLRAAGAGGCWQPPRLAGGATRGLPRGRCACLAAGDVLASNAAAACLPAAAVRYTWPLPPCTPPAPFHPAALLAGSGPHRGGARGADKGGLPRCHLLQPILLQDGGRGGRAAEGVHALPGHLVLSRACQRADWAAGHKAVRRAEPQ